MQEDRARIYDEYDKRNRKGVYAPCDNPDSDDYYLTPAEKRKALEEKLAADGVGSALDRRKEAEVRMYAKPESPLAQFESREAFKDYIQARHPGLSEADWKVLNDDAWFKTTSDLAGLQKRAIKSGAQEDLDITIDRAVAELEIKKQQADRRSAFAKMAKERRPVLDLKG